MPQRDIRLLLRDVMDACDVITRGVSGMSFLDYTSGDVIIRSAVERQFEIIGEAVKRILAVEAGLTI